MKNFKEGGFRKGGSDFKKRGSDFGGKPKFGGNRQDQGGDRGGFRGGSDKGGRSFGSSSPAELFPATCSTCHKPCEVPFRPSSDKPVYCSACFGKKNQDDGREFNGAQRGGDREFKKDARPQREERSPRYETAPKTTDADLVEVKRQLASLEGKMNRVLDLLNAQVNQSDLELTTATPAPVVASKKTEKTKMKKIVPTTKVAKVVIKKVVPVAKSTKVIKKVTKAVKVVKKAVKKGKK